MPIQFPDFNRISFDEANPYLVGAERGQKFAQSNIQFPLDMRAKMLANQIAQVKAQYAQPMAAQALIGVQQENQWNPKIWGSEINLRGAQSGEASANASYLRSQAGSNNLMLEYLRQKLHGGGGAPMAAGNNVGSGGGGMAMPPGSGGGGGGNVAPGGDDDGSGQQAGSPTTTMTNQGEAPVSDSSQQPQAPGQEQAQQPAAPQATADTTPQTNSYYGIDTPQPSADDIINKKFFGMDTFTPKLTNATGQQMDQYKQYQEEMAESIKESNAAQKMQQVLSLFNNAMNNANYKGEVLGHTPSSGWTTALTPGNMSNEQLADTYASQLLPSAMSDLRQAMQSGQFSVADLNAAQNMKVNRSMDDETRRAQTEWLGAVFDRTKEKPKFYAMMGNPKSGAQKSIADMAWQTYQNQNPLISKDGKTVLRDNLGKWPLYTSPKAIQSIKETGTYVPGKSAKGNFWIQTPPSHDYPNGRIVPIKKQYVEQAILAGGRPV